MKYKNAILLFGVLALISPACLFAADPSSFMEILGFNLFKAVGDGDFGPVQARFGKSRVISTGDASTGEQDVLYFLSDGRQKITFYNTECETGYTIEGIQKIKSLRVAFLPTNIKSLSAGGLHLGMKKNDVDSFMKNVALGKWKFKKKNPDDEAYFYRRNEVAQNGTTFCDHIWISLGFASDGTLNKIEVSGGGCDDGPCDEIW